MASPRSAATEGASDVRVGDRLAAAFRRREQAAEAPDTTATYAVLNVDGAAIPRHERPALEPGEV